MKRIIISLVLLCTTFSVLLPFVGTVNQNTFLGISRNTTVLQRFQQPFEATQQSYVSGGIVVVYPTAFFDTQPIVLVSIQLNENSAAGFMYLAEVDAASDANSCTITVYKLPLAGGAAVEAASDEVAVSILAIANANG